MINNHVYIYINLSDNLFHFFFLNCSCDADPSALAKYVVALVKKDKSEKELKALCIDQLDVFLQKGKFKSFYSRKLYFAATLFGLYS